MGRHFDRMCSVVERHWKNPKLHGLLKQARLFDFPARLHEVAQAMEGKAKRLSDYSLLGGPDFVFEHFFLPFPVVAVEDTASCVLVIDEAPDQCGLNVRRSIFECYDAHTPSEEFGRSTVEDAETREKVAKGIPRDASIVMASRIVSAERKSTGAPIAYDGEFGFGMIVSKSEGMLLRPEQFAVSMSMSGRAGVVAQNALQNGISALEEIMYFNTPDRFVVRQSAQRPRVKGRGATDLLRSHEREHYILLTPHEIRERFGISDEPVVDRKSPAPHARRRHYRTLRADRYKEAKGKTIVVPATWIGPASGEYKGRRYEVCLDL